MENKLQKLIYFLSAEAPVAIVFAILWIYQKSSWMNPITISWKIPMVLFVASIILIIAFNISFDYGKKNLQSINVTVNNHKNEDGWIVAYIATYMLPLVSLRFEDVTYIVMIIIVILFLFTFVFTDFITPHPILYFRGYKFYEIDVEGAAAGYHLISRRRLRKSDDVKIVAQVFEFLLIRIE